MPASFPHIRWRCRRTATADIAFYAALAITLIGSAAWLLYDFSERVRARALFPRRPSRAERPPEWMRREVAGHRLPDVPPAVGPPRLPSFASRVECAPGHAPAPRRTQRPHRARTSSLGNAV